MDLHILITTTVNQSAEPPSTWIIAVCLERHIVAQAKTVANAHMEIERMIAAHAALDMDEGKEPLGTQRPAPGTYMEAWETAEPAPQLTLITFEFEMKSRGGIVPITEVHGAREYRVDASVLDADPHWRATFG